jgi:hypothetical protein
MLILQSDNLQGLEQIKYAPSFVSSVHKVQNTPAYLSSCVCPLTGMLHLENCPTDFDSL